MRLAPSAVMSDLASNLHLHQSDAHSITCRRPPHVRNTRRKLISGPQYVNLQRQRLRPVDTWATSTSPYLGPAGLSLQTSTDRIEPKCLTMQGSVSSDTPKVRVDAQANTAVPQTLETCPSLLQSQYIRSPGFNSMYRFSLA